MASLDELETLSRYLAGELAPEEAARLEAVLPTRPDLQQALAQMRALDDAAQDLPDTLSGAQAEALIRRVPRPRRALARRPLLWRALAASLLLGVSAWGAWDRLAPPGEVVALNDSVSVGGLPIAPLASRPIPEEGEIHTGSRGTALVQLRRSSLILHPDTQIVVARQRRAEAKLLEGTLLAAGKELSLTAGTERIDLAGRALVSTEPWEQLSRVLEENSGGGHAMDARWKKSLPVMAGAAVGSLLTVVVMEGRATVTSAAGTTMPIVAGQQWQRGEPRATAIPPSRPPLLASREQALAGSPPTSVLSAHQERPAAPRTLPELEELDALQKRVQDLEQELNLERKLREQLEGAPTERPTDLPGRFAEERLRGVIAEGFKTLGFKNEITSVDCTEYPCIVYGEGSLNSKEWEKLISSGPLQEYKGDATRAWGWNDAGKKLFGIVLQPKASGAGIEAQKRLNFRVQLMKEAK